MDGGRDNVKGVPRPPQLFRTEKRGVCETLTGQVTTRDFSIKTSYAEMKFKRSEIVHIHFENPPQFTQDEMLLLASDVLKGVVSPATVTIRLETSGQTVKLSKDKIHTIMFLDSV